MFNNFRLLNSVKHYKTFHVMKTDAKQKEKTPKEYPFVGIRPSKEQKARLKRLAKASKRSMSELYVMAMERALPAFEAETAAVSGKKF
jgi:hypothetical protein